MEMSKIRATDDHQEYGDASICLDADEMRAFFGTFARVEEEFHQLIASLPVKKLPTPAVVATTSTADPAVATSIEKLHQADKLPTSAAASLKRKWSTPPASGAESTQDQD